MIRGTMGMSKGKWDWEGKLGSMSGQAMGVCTTNVNIPLATDQNDGFVIYSTGGDSHTFSLYANSHYRSYFGYDGSNSNSSSGFNAKVFLITQDEQVIAAVPSSI